MAITKDDEKNFFILFEKQHYHLVATIALTIILFTFYSLENFTKGSFSGITTETWILIVFLIPIIHQVFVMIIWRSELHFSLISQKLGSLGFKLYGIFFMILFLSRFVVLVALAQANNNTLIIGDYSLHVLLTIIILFLGLYLGYSMKRYFGVKRALGIDHFDSEYTKKKMVKKGIFKYVNNSMYTVGFLLFYIPGLLFSSLAALLLAFIHHIYIWVHYYTTEKPDMKRIYEN